MTEPWHRGATGRAVIVANPVAGHRDPPELAQRAATRLRDGGWDVEIAPTRHHGHATEIASANRDSADLIVAVGGDGTVREVVAGIEGSGVPVGFVPLGNANVLARELGIPLDPEAAIRLLDEGVPRPIDVGRVDDAIFLTMVGIGYDGWAVSGVGRLRATRPGRWVYRHGGSSLLYGLSGIPPLLRLVPTRVEVEVDGTPLPGRYPSLVICNAETYALGWAMAPGAAMDDGRLNHHANRRAAAPFLLWTLLAALRHQRLSRFFADYGHGVRYRVRAARPFRWQIDGDPMPPARELTISVKRAAARIIGPRPGSD